MNLNSQSLFYPPQPDNPSDSERYTLSLHALAQKGRPEDFNYVIKLLSPPSPITTYANPGQFKDVKVAVIGGGLAGLAAAFELRKLGFDITIYEAIENRVGGRVYTYYFDGQDDLYNEFGPARIPVTHETVWHYLKLFKLPTRPFIQYNEYEYAYFRGVRVRNDRSGSNVMRYIYPKYDLAQNEQRTNWQTLQQYGLESQLLYASPEVRAEILQVKPFYNKRTLLWSNNSSIRMMESEGLSQDAISLVSSFAPLLYGNLYNSYIDFIEESYPVDLSFLYEIPGGMVRLPKAFYNSLLNPSPQNDYPDIKAISLGKVEYKAGCWVKGISLNSVDQKVILNYKDLKVKDKFEEKFDYVVCAIPFSSLRNVKIDPLFSNLKMRAIREVYYTPSQKSLLLCKERFWEKEGIVGGISFTDLPISSILYPSDHAKYIHDIPYNKPGVLVGSYNFSLDTTRLANLPEDEFFSEVKREIELVHGLQLGYLDNIVKDFKTVNWEKEPTFRGALTFFEPEQKRLFHYAMALPEYNSRIFFAGEHISAVHRWMQGALQSGMQAANDLAAACRQQFQE